jgi:hypothetical protein
MLPVDDVTAWLRLSRRELLRALLGLAAYLPTSLLLAAAGESTTRTFSLSALGPFLDTLLPEDDTPSATQLDVDRAVVERMQNNQRMAQVVVMGCAWLDQQAVALGAADFASLQAEQRELIVQRAEQSAPRTLPRAFFSGTRALAFDEYYARPESWPSLGYLGPPQPRGFMDYAEPTRVASG